MKKTIKILSIISIVIGGVAILSTANGGSDPWASFVGGGMFLAMGICNLVYINQIKTYESQNTKDDNI